MRHNTNHKEAKGECKTCQDEELIDKAKKEMKKLTK